MKALKVRKSGTQSLYEPASAVEAWPMYFREQRRN